jgi:hypothetical protein
MAYAKVLRRRTPKGRSAALRFGGHVHAALAYKYRVMANGKEATDDTINRILSCRFERDPLEDEDWRNVNMAQALLFEYNLKYQETLDIPRLKGFPWVEKPFALWAGNIGKRKIIYMGRIDLVMRQGPHTYILDHKTSSILGDTYWKDAGVSEQQRGYCWAYREVSGEEPIGYKINVLAARKPTKTGKAIEFQRSTTFTREPAGQLDIWHANMLQQVETFLWHVDRNVFPRHHKHCVHKYGTCSFYSVCELAPTLQETALMSSEFEENTWSPLYKV